MKSLMKRVQRDDAKERRTNNTYHSDNCLFVKSLGVGNCDCGLDEALKSPPPSQIPPISEYEDRL